jgi:hypothetical protein
MTPPMMPPRPMAAPHGPAPYGAPFAPPPAARPVASSRRPAPLGRQSMAAVGVLSDYLIRTASILGILAILGVASVAGEHQAPTDGATASATQQSQR